MATGEKREKAWSNALTAACAGIILMGFFVLLGGALHGCEPGTGAIDNPFAWWAGMLGGTLLMSIGAALMAYLNTGE